MARGITVEFGKELGTASKELGHLKSFDELRPNIVSDLALNEDS